MSRARNQNKVCGCAPLPLLCPLRHLCLSPPGRLGWRLGGLFTFNLAMKLMAGAWEREERFQLRGSPGCLPPGPGAQGADNVLSPGGTGEPSLILTVNLPVHTHIQSPCTPTQNPTCREYDPRHSDPKTHGQTATLSRTCLHSHPAHSPSARRAHCHSKPARLSGSQTHGFHFVSAALLQTALPGSLPPRLEVWKHQAPPNPLEIWSFLVLLQGNPLSSEAACELVLKALTDARSTRTPWSQRDPRSTCFLSPSSPFLLSQKRLFCFLTD